MHQTSSSLQETVLAPTNVVIDKETKNRDFALRREGRSMHVPTAISSRGAWTTKLGLLLLLMVTTRLHQTLLLVMLPILQQSRNCCCSLIIIGLWKTWLHAGVPSTLTGALFILNWGKQLIVMMQMKCDFVWCGIWSESDSDNVPRRYMTFIFRAWWYKSTSCTMIPHSLGFEFQTCNALLNGARQP